MSERRERGSLPARLWMNLRLMRRIAADPGLPRRARLIPGLVAAYLLSPIDLVPDFIPVLGYLDDLVVVSLLLWLFFRLVPDQLAEKHQAALESGPPEAFSWESLIREFAPNK